MGLFEDFRRFITEIAGEVVSSNINMIGELTGNKYAKEIGQGVKSSFKGEGETFYQATEGSGKVSSDLSSGDIQR